MIVGKVKFCSKEIGNFIRVYLKYVLISFTAIIIFLNLFLNFKERKKNEKNKNKSIK